MRKNLGIRNLSDEMVSHCKKAHQHHKVMRGIPNYEITWNTRYASAIQYTPVELRDTDQEKLNSDFVLKCLNHAYLPKTTPPEYSNLQDKNIIV